LDARKEALAPKKEQAGRIWPKANSDAGVVLAAASRLPEYKKIEN